MKRQIQILPRALHDGLEARQWYEDQREGLGYEFDQTLEAAMISIDRFPELFPKVVDDVRRCLLGRFPYGIFYESHQNNLIVIVAILHVSRDPKTWQDLQH